MLISLGNSSYLGFREDKYTNFYSPDSGSTIKRGISSEYPNDLKKFAERNLRHTNTLFSIVWKSDFNDRSLYWILGSGSLFYPNFDEDSGVQNTIIDPANWSSKNINDNFFLIIF